MKKVVSAALALVMIFSFMTVAFAADPTSALKVEIIPTAASYEKGDTVTFEIQLTSNPDLLGGMGNAPEVWIGFNGDVFEFVEDISSKPDFPNQETVITTGYKVDDDIVKANCYIADATSSVTFSSAEQAKGWTKALRISMTPVIPKAFADDYSAGGKLLAFKLKVKDTATAGKFENCVGLINNEKSTFDEELGAINEDAELAAELEVDSVFNRVDATVTVEGAEDSKIIKAVKDNEGNVLSYVGWGNYDEKKDTCDEDMTTGKLNFAIRGTFDAADIAPETGKISFDETNKRTVQEIEALSASAKIGGVEKGPCSTQFIYGAANGEGSYEYFVVIEGVNYADITDGTLTVEITFGGTLTAGGAISGETVTVNLKDAYDAAVARSLPPYSAS